MSPFLFREKSIFVIHSEQDGYLIQRLVNHFKEQFFENIRFNIEWLSSKSGKYTSENFGKRIRVLIRNCDYFLIILTNNSKKSIWVNQEIGFAFSQSMGRCLFMVDEALRGQTFGMIHPNIDVQYFQYGDFNIKKIDERLSELEKVRYIVPIISGEEFYVV